MRGRKVTAEDVLAHVDIRGADECWPWTGRLSPRGYGVVWWNGREQRAHRAVVEIITGEPIPEGRQGDHTCHNRDATCPGGDACLHRRCSNPAHVEAVDARTNLLRSTHTEAGRRSRQTECVYGHALDAANTYIAPKTGHRGCRKCRHRRTTEHRAKRTGANA